MRVFPLLAIVGLSACTTGGLQSYVTPLSPAAGARAAADIVGFVKQQTKPEDGPLSLQVPVGDTVVSPLLISDLKEAGYTITDGRSRHRLRYAVSVLNDETLLRATIDTTAAARLYHTNGTTIEPSGPFTVVEQGS